MDYGLITLLITSGVLLATIKWWGRMISSLIERNRKVGDSIMAVSSVYDAMIDICAHSEIDRIWVLKTENGGGVPQVGSQIYSTIVYEYITGHSANPIKQMYSRFECDREYVRVLADINRENKPYVFHVKKETPGTLTVMFESIDVEVAYFYFIGHNKKTFYFMIIADSGKGLIEDARSKASIMSGINKIRYLFNKYMK